MAEPVAVPPDSPVPRGLDDAAVQRLLGRVDELLDRVEQLPGPTSEAAIEAIQALTQLYGEALARITAMADGGLLDRLVDDELCEHLLALHDLHPRPLTGRVEHALERVRPAIEAQGGSVELDGIENGTARVRISTGGHGCGSSAAAFDTAVVDAVTALAPELVAVEPVHDNPPGATAFIPAADLLRRPSPVGGLP